MHKLEIDPAIVRKLFSEIEEYQGVVEIIDVDVLIKGMVALANSPIGGGSETPFRVLLGNLLRQAVELGSKGVKTTPGLHS